MSIEEQMNVDERRKYLPNGVRYRRLGRTNSRNGKLPKLRTSLKKRAESQPSGARFVRQQLSRVWCSGTRK